MVDDISLDVLKKRIQYLFENHPNIHVNINLTHPKIHKENAPVTIVGVYPHIFIVSDNSKSISEKYTLKYTDVWIGQIEIIELKKFK